MHNIIKSCNCIPKIMRVLRGTESLTHSCAVTDKQIKPTARWILTWINLIHVWQT